MDSHSFSFMSLGKKKKRKEKKLYTGVGHIWAVAGDNNISRTALEEACLLPSRSKAEK